MSKPRLLITMGDVAGVGPEIIAGAWDKLRELADVAVVGDAAWMAKCDPSVPVIQGTGRDLSGVSPGEVSAAAGGAAYDFLCEAIDRCMAGEADGVVTAPLHKEGLHAAGVPHPGHTEILAERTGAASHVMLLHGPNFGSTDASKGRPPQPPLAKGGLGGVVSSAYPPLSRGGLGEGPPDPSPHFDDTKSLTVAHVTLHTGLRDIFAHITTDAILEKIRLLAEIRPKLRPGQTRIAVAGLNPHAGDGGLFGDEEARLIAPAIERAKAEGIDAVGPVSSDTLFLRAAAGEFGGVVVMYHDQGHIAMKLRCGWDLVNVTAGLPIVRTSVAHGTAYDIAWKGLADPSSMVEATRVASRLVKSDE